jgi:hypothetical protein
MQLPDEDKFRKAKGVRDCAVDLAAYRVGIKLRKRL